MSVITPEGTLVIENSHLDVRGNVNAVALKLGTARLTPSYDLAAVTGVGNTTPYTVEFSNATTGLATTSNLQVGGTLKLGGTVDFENPLSLAAVSLVSNTTPYTIEFSNAATGIATTANIAVGGDVQIRGTTFIKANSNTNNLAIGTNAGETTQGQYAVAVGYQAGQTSQENNAVAVGYEAGKTTQGPTAIAVGRRAGQTSQGSSAVAVGFFAGNTSQGNNAIAVGLEAGETTQGSSAVAVGRRAGETSQGQHAIAVGHLAGETSQGSSAVAVGYQAGKTSQHDNSIVLNASGSTLNTAGASRTYIKPLQAGVVAGNMMAYDSTSGEVINYTGVSVNASGNMDVSGDLTAGCPVFFNVKKETDSDFGSDTTLVFPDVRKNKGNGYNSSDGIFTAPIAGSYFFIFTASTRNDSDDNIVKFRKNGSSRSNNRSDSDSNDVDSMGLHIIIDLDVDDTVNVSFEGHLSRAPTYFSGFYLSS